MTVRSYLSVVQSANTNLTAGLRYAPASHTSSQRVYLCKDQRVFRHGLDHRDLSRFPRRCTERDYGKRSFSALMGKRLTLVL